MLRSSILLCAILALWATAFACDPADKTTPLYDVPLVQYDAAHCRVLGELARTIALRRQKGVTLVQAIASEESSFPRAVHSWGPQLARLVYGERLGEKEAYARVARVCRTLK